MVALGRHFLSCLAWTCQAWSADDRLKQSEACSGSRIRSMIGLALTLEGIHKLVEVFLCSCRAQLLYHEDCQQQ